MSRHVSDGLLDPLSSRIAQMRAADVSIETAALMCEISPETARQICLRPEVIRYVIKLQAFSGRITEASMQDLDQAIQEKAARAFEIESKAMEDLVDIGDRNMSHDDGIAIKAITAAATTAQDILDRAGKRAPTVVKTQRATGQIPQAVLDNLGNVLDEMRVTVDVTETK